MNLQQLRHVVVLARAGTFARAAEILGIAQPALSRSIKAVEQRYGIRLFERGRFGAVLTPAGHSVLQEMQDIVRRSDALHQELSHYREGSLERVRFGVAQLPARAVLAPLLARVVSARPSLALDASVEDTPALLDRLARGEIEFALCFEHTLPAPGLSVEHIASVRTSLLVREGHPLLARQPVGIATVYDYPVVMSQGATAGLDPTVLCGSDDALRGMVREADAIWPTVMLPSGHEPGLVELRITDNEQHLRDLALVTAPIAGLSSPARYVIAELRNLAAELYRPLT